jgi:hypothetical protein
MYEGPGAWTLYGVVSGWALIYWRLVERRERGTPQLIIERAALSVFEQRTHP